MKEITTILEFIKLVIGCSFIAAGIANLFYFMFMGTEFIKEQWYTFVGLVFIGALLLI